MFSSGIKIQNQQQRAACTTSLPHPHLKEICIIRNIHIECKICKHLVLRYVHILQ